MPFFLQKEFLTERRRLLSSRAGKLPSSRLTISPWLRAFALEPFPAGQGLSLPAPPRAPRNEGAVTPAPAPTPRGAAGGAVPALELGVAQPGDPHELWGPAVAPCPVPPAPPPAPRSVCLTRSPGFSPQFEPLTQLRKQSRVWLIPLTSAEPLRRPASAADSGTSPLFNPSSFQPSPRSLLHPPGSTRSREPQGRRVGRCLGSH